MIRIRRSMPAPAALQAGAALVNIMHRAVAERPGVAGGKNEPFTFDDGIVGHPTVKAALIAMQHKKCAYCEGDLQAFGYGETEHHRPKGYSQQAVGRPTIRPGYYWLAYDWLNLLFSCERCNKMRKRNVFPLRNPAARARTPPDVANEEPLLLDPSGGADPRAHICFKSDFPTARTDIGEQSIRWFALDRDELSGARARHLGHVDALTRLIRAAERPGANPS